MEWGAVFMLSSCPVFLLAGTVLGFLSGLGTGGGSLLLLWLTMVVGMPQQDARMVNLLFYLPAALITLLLRKKQGLLPVKPLLPGMAAGCAAAFLFSRLENILDAVLMKKAFGVLLLFLGIRELFYRRR